MRKRRCLLLVAPLAFAADTALAGWQYTDWGMSPEQVVKASDGSAVPDPRAVDVPNGPYETKLRAAYSAQGIMFRAYFLFSRANGGLEAVRLEADDTSDCPKLGAMMDKIYSPSRDKSSLRLEDRKSTRLNSSH